ncbi:hypothetical protein L21SP2_0694 [Salinispira pacifica]|uniref:Uncharacterized protein n=1 Tax=Salinispira pacifica TaxID=1307761 RepID=V5WG31_9SPIO|nr:hypothetical protein L21SP2_0694 [Salinispira pacifica]
MNGKKPRKKVLFSRAGSPDIQDSEVLWKYISLISQDGSKSWSLR